MDYNNPALLLGIFRALRQLIKAEITGHDGFISIVNQIDTYYLVRYDKTQAASSYFASVQIRANSVYLQLHTFVNAPFFDGSMLPEAFSANVDPFGRSLIFRTSINPLREELIELIRHALHR